MTADLTALNVTPESGAIHLNADDIRQLSDIGFWRSTQTKITVFILDPGSA